MSKVEIGKESAARTEQPKESGPDVFVEGIKTGMLREGLKRELGDCKMHIYNFIAGLERIVSLSQKRRGYVEESVYIALAKGIKAKNEILKFQQNDGMGKE